MPILLKTKSIYFNDVNLIPQAGVVKSRKDVPNEIWRVIVSPMVSVIGETFIKQAARLGLSVAIPRFIDFNKKIQLAGIFNNFSTNSNQLCFVSIGLNENRENIEFLSHNTHHNKSILFDIANGYIPQLNDCVKRIAEEFEIKNLMIGNVVTGDGLRNLIGSFARMCGTLYCRIGIGNGGPCSTSDVTGINRGQITELFECREEVNDIYTCVDSPKKTKLVSDGGIYKSGYAVKAFGAGADYCLMGNYFVKAQEAETHISGDGSYFGCASEKQNQLAGLDKTSEGKIREVNKSELQPLEKLVKDLVGGISSGISYCGYSSVTDFIGNGIFEIKQNSLPPKNRI